MLYIGQYFPRFSYIAVISPAQRLEIGCKIWETRKIFPTLHLAPFDNIYLLLASTSSYYPFSLNDAKHSILFY